MRHTLERGSPYTLRVNHIPSSCSRRSPALLPAPAPARTTRGPTSTNPVRLRQLCVRKRDLKLRISKGQYYAHPGRYRVRLRCRLRAWDVGLEEWDAGLALIASVNGLGHPPGGPSAGSIRAEVASVASLPRLVPLVIGPARGGFRNIQASFLRQLASHLDAKRLRR